MCDDADDLTKSPLTTTDKFGILGIYQHDLKGKSVEEFLSEIYGDPSYKMDCSLFTQLIHHDSKKSILTLILPITDHAKLILWDIFPFNVRYMGLDDDRALEICCEISTSHKGIFLTKLDNERYLGLSDDGPLILSQQEWAQYCSGGLRKWLDGEHKRHSSLSVEYSRTKILECLLKMGKLDKWSLYNDGCCHKSDESEFSCGIRIVDSGFDRWSDKRLGGIEIPHPSFLFIHDHSRLPDNENVSIKRYTSTSLTRSRNSRFLYKRTHQSSMKKKRNFQFNSGR